MGACPEKEKTPAEVEKEKDAKAIRKSGRIADRTTKKAEEKSSKKAARLMEKKDAMAKGEGLCDDICVKFVDKQVNGASWTDLCTWNKCKGCPQCKKAAAG